MLVEHAECESFVAEGKKRNRVLLRRSLPPPVVVVLMLFFVGMTSGVHASPLCSPVELQTIEMLLDRAEDSIELVDYAPALSTLDKIELEVRCVQDVVPAAYLSRMHVLRGLVKFYLGDLEQAYRSFQNAIAVDRHLRWDKKHGVKAGEAFLEAKEDSLDLQPQPLYCPLLVPGIQVYLDGRGLTQGESSTHLPGDHFLQIRWPDGHWEGSFFELPSNRRVSLPLPNDAILAEESVKPVGSGDAPASDGKLESDGESSASPEGSPGIGSEFGARAAEPGRGPAYVASGATVVGLAGVVVFGLNYRRTAAELVSGDYYQDADDPEKDALLRANARYAYLTTASWALTGVSLAATIYFGVRSGPSHSDTHRDDREARLTPWFSPSGAGVVVSKSF